MTVRVYRWDDASAPVLTGNAADYKIIDVLDKCLVAGYGSKAAAGWSKPYTGTSKAVFRSGTGGTQRYVRIDCSAGSQYPRIRGYESITDVDTGSGPFPTDAQVSGGLYLVTSSTADTTARPWVVVADEKRFYLYVGHSDTTAIGLASTAAKPMFFFGDIDTYKTGDAYHCLIVAATSGSASATYLAGAAAATTAVAGHYTARDYTNTGGSIEAAKTCDAQRYTATPTLGAVGTAYPSPITGSLDLAPVYIHDRVLNALRGKMPGLWCPLHNLPAAPGDIFSGSGTLSGKTFLLLDAANAATRGRLAIETSDTW